LLEFFVCGCMVNPCEFYHIRNCVLFLDLVNEILLLEPILEKDEYSHSLLVENQLQGLLLWLEIKLLLVDYHEVLQRIESESISRHLLFIGCLSV